MQKLFEEQELRARSGTSTDVLQLDEPNPNNERLIPLIYVLTARPVLGLDDFVNLLSGFGIVTQEMIVTVRSFIIIHENREVVYLENYQIHEEEFSPQPFEHDVDLIMEKLDELEQTGEDDDLFKQD